MLSTIPQLFVVLVKIRKQLDTCVIRNSNEAIDALNCGNFDFPLVFVFRQIMACTVCTIQIQNRFFVVGCFIFGLESNIFR